MKPVLRRRLPRAFLPVLLLILCLPALGRGQVSLSFKHVVIDADGPRDPWGKAVGDLNGDGATDLIVGGYASGGLVWYENPSWRAHVVSSLPGFRTDDETGDVDRDGRIDIVSLGSDSSGNPLLEWFKNPGSLDGRWISTPIDQLSLHDIELADLDRDGRIDVVGRNQEAFAPFHGDTLYIYLQKSPVQWAKYEIPCQNGEGLKVCDVNRDGRPDIVINQFWYENAGDGSTWSVHRYTATYTHRSVSLDVADIDGDSRADILLAPSETVGGTYRISWFEAPSDPTQPAWTEHIIEDNVETVHHSMVAADFNLDGRLDVATAMMNTARTLPEIKVFLNGGQGQTWSKRVIGTTGSHDLHVVDVAGNGANGLFGANFSGNDVDLWINQSDTATPVGGDGRRPLQFNLEQNYPNPFNPSTTIKFQVAEDGYVRLTVYNLLGMPVGVLVDGQRKAGVYEVQWNGSDVASGVYVYRLEAGPFVQTRRMMLLR